MIGKDTKEETSKKKRGKRIEKGNKIDTSHETQVKEKQTQGIRFMIGQINHRQRFRSQQ